MQAICLYSSGHGYSGNYHEQYVALDDDAIVAGGGAFAWLDYGAVAANFTGHTFALTFTSANEERFTTIPINLDGEDTQPATTAQYIEDALMALPNGVIDKVQVDVAYNDDGTGITGGAVVDDFPCDILAVVTFDGTQVNSTSVV